MKAWRCRFIRRYVEFRGSIWDVNHGNLSRVCVQNGVLKDAAVPFSRIKEANVKSAKTCSQESAEGERSPGDPRRSTGKRRGSPVLG